MTIDVSHAAGSLRRVVLSCDAPACANQLEPPAAEHWRSDVDARTWARNQATGWTHDPRGGTDHCPGHAGYRALAPVGVVTPAPAAPRPALGSPRERDEYAARLDARLAGDGRTGGPRHILSTAQAEVVARLLDEFAARYPGERLGALVREMSALLNTPPDPSA
jgi:hypothetical protein